MAKFSIRLTGELLATGRKVSDTIYIEADSSEAAEQALAVALRRLAAPVSDSPAPTHANAWGKARMCEPIRN